MYSSSNKDFVRGTVTSFYEMFKQLSVRGGSSSNNGEEEDEEQRDFRAFAFGNNTLDEEKVCPTDDLEWQLKVRNQAMKRGCASEQMDGLKLSLFAVRVVVDTIVRTMFLILDIVVCLFRLLIPCNGESEFAQIMAELDFLFNELINTIIEAAKQLANMLFNLIFSSGDLGAAMKEIVMALCKMVQFILAAWNETGVCTAYHTCAWTFFLSRSLPGLLHGSPLQVTCV
jgi:hypothetical protein